MTRSPALVAFLDACTLVPASLRDLLLRCADAELFQVRWSVDVLEEVRRTLTTTLALDPSSVDRLLAAMRHAFPDAEVDGYHSLMSGLRVDSGDRHVLAAAIVAGADVIVTRNVRHFPEDAVEPFGISVETPDKFLVGLTETSSEELGPIVSSRAHDLGDSIPETLAFLRQHVPGFVEVIESRELP